MADFPRNGFQIDTSQLTNIATNGNLLVQVLSKLVETLQDVLPFSGAFGTVTLSAAASTVVANPSVTATSVILAMPTNAAAATLMAGSNSLYVSARTAGTSFTWATAAGGSAAGTETFSYVILNP